MGSRGLVAAGGAVARPAGTPEPCVRPFGVAQACFERRRHFGAFAGAELSGPRGKKHERKSSRSLLPWGISLPGANVMLRREAPKHLYTTRQRFFAALRAATQKLTFVTPSLRSGQALSKARSLFPGGRDSSARCAGLRMTGCGVSFCVLTYRLNDMNSQNDIARLSNN